MVLISHNHLSKLDAKWISVIKAYIDLKDLTISCISLKTHEHIF